MSEKPLVSVVIPVHDHENFIFESLLSVHDQTYKNIELIIVDDASSDASFQRAEKYLSKSFKRRFVNTRLIRSTVNLGAHAAINEGIAASVGSHIAILNSDDVYKPGRINAQMESLRETGSEISFTLVSILIDPSHAGLIPESFQLFTTRQALALRRDLTSGFAILRSNVAVSTGNLLFTRMLYKKIGKFQPLQYCHDWDFLLQSLFFCEPAIVLEPLYEYRLHGSNSFKDLSPVAINESQIVIQRFFRQSLGANSANALAPTVENWPGYFEIFVSECGYENLLRKERGDGLAGWRTIEQVAPSELDNSQFSL